MKRLIPLPVVARALGYSPLYAQRVANDQGRQPDARKYPEATHERFPQFERDGNRKGYFVAEQTFNAFCRKNRKAWGVEL